MINTLSTDVYGLFNLDGAGTVMYSKIESGDYSAHGRTKLVGLNFLRKSRRLKMSKSVVAVFGILP